MRVNVRIASSPVGILRWEWKLANGGDVVAVVDTDLDVETVKQGLQVLSESKRGQRPEGHTVLVDSRRSPDDSDVRPPMEAVVRFDPKLPICVLRADGHDVAPAVWPARNRSAHPPAATGAPNHLLLVVLAACVVLFGVLLVTRRGDRGGAMPPGPLAGTHRASSGLFIAHYPTELEIKAAIMPDPVSGILLQDKAKAVAVVIAAMSAESAAASDVWTLQKRVRDEALANLPKGGARFEESTRSEDTCAGQPGAVVAGSLTENGAARAKIWSCAFKRDGAGYLALYMIPDASSADDAKRARAIVDATELTRLGDLGAAAQ